jgi:hypothetical protein
MNAWNKLFCTLDEVFANVSSLLLDAERMLGVRGYDIDQRSGIGAEKSSSVYSPGLWYPGWISRHFRSRDGASASIFVCVLLHARAGDDIPALEDPVVSAGILRPPDGAGWSYWMAKAWAWSPQRLTNGQPIGFEFRDGGKAEVFAVPLASITSAAVLERSVVEPLVKLASSGRGESTSAPT